MRWQTAPMTSTALHSPGVLQEATRMIGQGGASATTGGGAFASGTGGSGAQLAPRAARPARRSHAPGRGWNLSNMAEGLVEGGGRDKGQFCG